MGVESTAVDVNFYGGRVMEGYFTAVPVNLRLLVFEDVVRVR